MKKSINACTKTPLTDDEVERIWRYSRSKKFARCNLLNKKKYALARSVLQIGGKKYALMTSTKSKGDILIGKGSAKNAKLAVDLSTGKIKLIAACRRNGLDEDVWNEMLSEIELLQKFQGRPGVVQVEAAYATADKYYLVMEYCQERDLETALGTRKLGNFSSRLRIAADCVEGAKTSTQKKFCIGTSSCLTSFYTATAAAIFERKSEISDQQPISMMSSKDESSSARAKYGLLRSLKPLNKETPP